MLRPARSRGVSADSRRAMTPSPFTVRRRMKFNLSSRNMLYSYKKGRLSSHSNSISPDSFPPNLTINVCLPLGKEPFHLQRPSAGLYFCLSEVKMNELISTMCFDSAPGSRKAMPLNTSAFLVYSRPSSIIISFLIISGRLSLLPSLLVYSTMKEGVSIAVERIGYTFRPASFFSEDSANAIPAIRARPTITDIFFVILLIII